MKKFGIYLLCLVLWASPVVAQSDGSSQTSKDVMTRVTDALADGRRITVKIKGEPIRIERKGVGPKKMSRFSGKVIEVAPDHFVLSDTVLVFGSILVTVPFEKVASVKPQSKSLYRLRKTGEYATASVAAAGLTAVIVPGFLICVASNGKLCTTWTSPR